MVVRRFTRLFIALTLVVFGGSLVGCSRVSLVNNTRRAIVSDLLTNSNYKITAGGGVVAGSGMSGYVSVGEEFSPNVQTGTGIRVITNVTGSVPSQ